MKELDVINLLTNYLIFFIYFNSFLIFSVIFFCYVMGGGTNELFVIFILQITTCQKVIITYVS